MSTAIAHLLVETPVTSSKQHDRDIQQQQMLTMAQVFHRWSLALQEDIVKAMGLTGQLLMGQAVMVKSAEVLFVLPWSDAEHKPRLSIPLSSTI